MKKFTLLLILGFLSIVLMDCQSNTKNQSGSAAKRKTLSNPMEDKSLKNQIEQELQEEQLLGKLLLENFIKDYGNFNSDKPLNKYIQLSGNNISYQFGRSEIVFKFGILNTMEVNAYSLPGGYVLLTRGLLEKIKNESELAAVMGHEVAHINQKHIFKTVRKDRQIGFAETLTSILSMGKASLSSAMSQAIGESVQLLTKTGLNREQEFEADEYGVSFASQAGYDPRDYINLLNRLKTKSDSTNLKNTHPPFDMRVAKIEAMIKSNSISTELRWDKNSLDERFSLNFKNLTKME